MNAASLLFVVAVVGWAAPGATGGDRLVRMRRPRDGAEPRRHRGSVVDGLRSRGASPLVGAAGAGVLVATVVGGVTGVLCGGTVGIATWWWVGRLEPGALRRRREQVERDLPFAVDLFAGALAAGASVPRALTVSGDAVEGPVGEAFARAGAAVLLGASADEAVAGWHADRTLAALAPLARLLVRSDHGGVPVVPAAERLASDLRAGARWRVDAVARRVGVRATAPLGLCFLPAFVLLGVVPLVLGGLRAVTW